MEQEQQSAEAEAPVVVDPAADAVSVRASALAAEDKFLRRGAAAPAAQAEKPPEPPPDPKAEEAAKAAAELVDAPKLQAVQRKERELRDREAALEAEVAKRVAVEMAKAKPPEEKRGPSTLSSLRAAADKRAALKADGWTDTEIDRFAEGVFYGKFPPGTVPADAATRLEQARLEAEIISLRQEREQEKQQREAEQVRVAEEKKAAEQAAQTKQALDGYRAELGDYLKRLPPPLRALKAKAARNPEGAIEAMYDAALKLAMRGEDASDIAKLAEHVNTSLAEGWDGTAEEAQERDGATKQAGHQTPQGQAGKPVARVLSPERTAAATPTKPPAVTAAQLRERALEAEDRLLGRVR